VTFLDDLGARIARTRLTTTEKAWAEAIFEAMLPADTAGLPAFASVDRAAFWHCLEDAPGPSFGPGLRAMVHGLTFLPLTDRRFRKPFYALDRDNREALVAELGRDSRYAVRQMVTTMKMMACFAYFDDAGVRARFDAASGGGR
jgi:hypothetical protein